MDRNIELLELALKRNELNLFFQGSGMYSMGTNPFNSQPRSIMADEALHVIYRYHTDNDEVRIYKKIEEMILDWLSYKSGKGVYKAFIVLATMRRNELQNQATFSCRFDYLSKIISESVIIFKEKLFELKEMESTNQTLGMWSVLMYENQFYFDKYGFLVISFANEGERTLIENYIFDSFGLKNERLEKAVSKLASYDDICRECIYWIKNREFIPDNQCIRVEGYSAKELSEQTYLKPIGAFNYLISLRKNPKESLDNLKKGLPRK